MRKYQSISVQSFFGNNMRPKGQLRLTQMSHKDTVRRASPPDILVVIVIFVIFAGKWMILS